MLTAWPSGNAPTVYSLRSSVRVLEVGPVGGEQMLGHGLDAARPVDLRAARGGR